MAGISTCCLMDRPLAEALDTLSSVTDLIEVMDEGLHYIGDPSLFESYSGTFIIHAPYHGMNIASLFEPIRRASVTVMTGCLSTAATIGAGVVMHPGYYAWEQERRQAGVQFERSLCELTSAAADLSARFFFENMGAMNYFHLRTPADLASIDGCGFALDTGHANVNRCLPEFLAGRFDHMHIHDNDGRSDSHCAVGEGTIDFAPVMAALRRNRATAVVEVKTFADAEKSVLALSRI
jgi:sugar phosphate isomerase/epimerase